MREHRDAAVSASQAEPAAVRATLESVFRTSSAALVATLTRAFGPSRLDLVEAVVQDAFVRAMDEWQHATPANPAGWLLSVARNLALDHLRRERSFERRQDAVAHLLEDTSAAAAARAFAEGTGDIRLSGELADDHLRMIFVACHPVNTLPSQVVLALRTLCGLEVPAIARALYATDDAIEKRLVLARRRLRDANVDFELPPADELARRVDAVLSVLYLMFSEAHSGTTGPEVVDEDVAMEAIRLTTFLAQSRVTAGPVVLALLSLMHFHVSRFDARRGPDGRALTLREQDRARWDQRHIALGLRLLSESATGERASRYHLEAAIAALHATSATFDETPWAEVVGYYDRLVAVSPSALLARAVAIGHRDGPRAGLAELTSLDVSTHALSAYHAARAELLVALEQHGEADDAYRAARALAASEHERQYYDRRLAR